MPDCRDPQALEEQFIEAEEAWRDQVTAATALWRKRWLGPECALLHYAYCVRCDFSQDAQDALERLLRADHRRCAITHLIPERRQVSENGDLTKQEQFDVGQTVQLIQGLLFGVKAAQSLRTWKPGRELPDEFVEHISACICAYHNAWHLSHEPVSREEERRSGVPLDYPTDPYAKALAQLIRDSRFDARDALDITTWLIVRRLLEYLRPCEAQSEVSSADEPQASVFETQTKVLLVDDAEPPEGFAGPLTVRRTWEGQFGFYVDPVALGMTVLDQDMLDSLRLGWCAALPELRAWVADTGNAAPAIRLAPRLPGLTYLAGGSAGGLFACAMYAAAKATGLNSDASASVALQAVVQRESAQDEFDWDSDLSIDQIRIAPVDEESVKPKLDAARSKADLRHVVLEGDQADWAHAQEIVPDGLKVHGAESLAEVYKLLTGHARIERVLSDYSDACVEEWDSLWKTPPRYDAPSGDEDGLLYYVPPHFELRKADAGQVPELFLPVPEARGREDDAYTRIEGDTEEEVLANLLRESGDRLCVSEGPGAGKSVFTRRLLAFLGTQAGRAALELDAKAALAVRWEEQSLHGAWPEQFEQELARIVQPYCQAHGVSPQQVVKYALDNGRCVLILDALDQVQDEGRIKCVQDFLATVRRKGWKLRMIVTGRPREVESQRGHLFSGAWRYAKLLGFDEAQQYRYLYGPEWPPASDAEDAWLRRNLAGIDIERLVPQVDEANLPEDRRRRREAYLESLREQFSNYAEVTDLFRNPAVLHMVRGLIEAGVFEPFRQRGDLYVQTSKSMLYRGLDRVLSHRPTPGEIRRLEEILAAVAFEMMCRDAGHYRVEGETEVERVKAAAGVRPQKPITDAEWDRLESVTLLTNRTLLYGATSRVLAWPDRRMMEFYCGLHLACNLQANWVEPWTPEKSGATRPADPPVRCGDANVRRFAADSDWHEPWRFAIEMNPSIREDRVLLASLAELYQPPTQPEGAEKPHLRPTELMYRAWALLEEMPPQLRTFSEQPPLLDGREEVLKAYRAQFWRRVQEGDRIALQLVPEDWLAQLRKQGILHEPELEERRQRQGTEEREVVAIEPTPEAWIQHLHEQGLLTDREREERRGPQRTAVRCPPAANTDGTNPEEDRKPFLMGSPEGEGSEAEHPQHQVIVPPFLMQATQLTREQYVLFDAAYEKVHESLLKSKASEDRCPAIDVSWYDSFCLAMWIGAKLPTEAQWEYACRAGTTTAFHFGESLSSHQANFDGNYPYGGAEKGPYLAKTTPVGFYEPNGWKLYDLHGNVWEWCADWFDGQWYSKRKAKHGDEPAMDEGGPLPGSSRALRGGGWNYVGVDCRSAFRFDNEPDSRNDLGGVRLSWRCAFPAALSSLLSEL